MKRPCPACKRRRIKPSAMVCMKCWARVPEEHRNNVTVVFHDPDATKEDKETVVRAAFQALRLQRIQTAVAQQKRTTHNEH